MKMHRKVQAQLLTELCRQLFLKITYILYVIPFLFDLKRLMEWIKYLIYLQKWWSFYWSKTQKQEDFEHKQVSTILEQPIPLPFLVKFVDAEEVTKEKVNSAFNNGKNHRYIKC